ncbi:cell division protein FtsQ/DivIB [uncultured Dialister sp.]|uniref:cell division protein FtsQ/DivIB n=1 Tax=uncultured Dialister sp. TaxID=278064 RepID=UPI00261B41A2|nr:cell division protein FtsQ/DivIB [uncultured Dialister sp.]
MDNFKSFNDFLKEQHGNPEGFPEKPKVEEPPEEIVPPEDRPSVRKKGRHHAVHHGRGKAYAAGGLAVAAAAVLSLFFLPIPLGYIDLRGTDVLTVDDVIFEGRIREPVNVLQVSSSRLEERLSKDIRLSTVSVSRRFPFVLEVDVTDRIPLAIVQDQFGYAFLDKDGMVMDTTQSIKKVNVPLITGKRMGNLLLGDSVAGGELDAALDFLNHLSPEGLRVFSEINIGNGDDIKAYTRDGITVRLGSGPDMAGQAKLAENMVGDVKARGLSVEYLDANPASPFIKLKK